MMFSSLKKSVLSLAAVCGLLFSAQAQEQKPAPPPGGDKAGHGWHQTAEQRTDQWSKDLNLTPDQKAKFLKIEQDRDAQMAQARQDQNGDREKMKAQRQAQRDAQRALLTADQAKKFDQIQEERKQHKPGGDKKKGDKKTKKA